MTEIKTVGIIGFGVMGAAIGLNAAAAGYNVIFKELNEELVQTMYQERLKKPLEKRVKIGKISQNDMDKITSRTIGTSKNSDLSQCDLIIEAAIEKLDSKIQLFSELDKVCSESTIIVSNTSTFLIEQLMKKMSNPSRTAGLHYFFPANINRLVEIIRHEQTSNETFEALLEFTKNNKKIAISVKDFPGFAVNPVFISSYMVLDSFYGDQYNVATLDAISQHVLGAKFGVMWVQNGSGLSTCYHAAVSMNNYLATTDMGYPAVPIQLKKQSGDNTLWDLEDGAVSSDTKLLSKVRDHLLGSVFAVATHLVEKKVVSQSDLELGIRTSLAWPNGPFSMMNELGMEETRRLVHLAVGSAYFKMPKTFLGTTPGLWEL